jgi:MoxR-like ATPase
MSGEDPGGSRFDQAAAALAAVQTALARVIVGQDALIAELLIAVVAGGHVLLEGLPGLGKTHLAKGLAAVLGLKWARVQCTPDLMPADLTGAEILVANRAAGEALEFRRGPIFAQLVLIDEINRSTPRTQAALLEAMQERQVTSGGNRYVLPEPFCVIATQNPIELEGTYPLPEAQLDRFLFKLRVSYPEASALHALLDISLDREPADELDALLDQPRLLALAATCREALVAEPCRAAAVDLVLATQPGGVHAAAAARTHLRYGASPRALQALVRAARVRAVLAGRAHVDLADLESVAAPVLRHRLLLALDSELNGITTDEVIAELLGEWRHRQRQRP